MSNFLKEIKISNSTGDFALSSNSTPVSNIERVKVLTATTHIIELAATNNNTVQYFLDCQAGSTIDLTSLFDEITNSDTENITIEIALAIHPEPSATATSVTLNMPTGIKYIKESVLPQFLFPEIGTTYGMAFRCVKFTDGTTEIVGNLNSYSFEHDRTVTFA